MRVISGKYKGKKLQGFDIDGTRPTMDRVKESLFAIIQDYIKDSVVLDLYAGSGNLAIEALSNGAKEAYLVDKNKICIKTINDNIKELNIKNVYVYNDDANQKLFDFSKQNISFDIIFLDPPYNTKEIEKTLNFINNNINITNKNGIIICETELNIDYSKYNNLTIYKTKKYGKKNVNILKTK